MSFGSGNLNKRGCHCLVHPQARKPANGRKKKHIGGLKHETLVGQTYLQPRKCVLIDDGNYETFEPIGVGEVTT